MGTVGAYLNKAARSFAAAEMLLANEYGDFAASRAHYGCFYVARALLLYRRLTAPTHAGTIGEYGRLYSTSERLHPDFHTLLIRSFHAMRSADYDLTFDFSDEEVGEMITDGKGFLDAARSYLGRGSVRDIAQRS